MDQERSRRSVARPTATVPCPICGRTFSAEFINEHADACAVRYERKMSGGGAAANRSGEVTPAAQRASVSAVREGVQRSSRRVHARAQGSRVAARFGVCTRVVRGGSSCTAL